MAIKVLEIHHHGVRIGDSDRTLDDLRQFYTGVLGLESDSGRPDIPGIPGMWMNVGEVGQIHLIGGPSPSRLAQGPGKDPAGPHVALAVADIVAAKVELDRMGVSYWSLQGVTGPEAEQIFLTDPCGNMVELHQADKCRCRLKSRI
ncbi:VOC family protein [Vineibacter terrae]|uniref:VOC family protein n=1 Tax=Vineibacter terrae TaxID=2586908 RepID=UPI002E2F9A5C|nr:VOC family protein [Vineibacter terrae]HEX2890336.1 VOC family protein [Vineibacter terrae]